MKITCIQKNILSIALFSIVSTATANGCLDKLPIKQKNRTLSEILPVLQCLDSKPPGLSASSWTNATTGCPEYDGNMELNCINIKNVIA